jgi:hypothetical protein
MPNTFSFDIGSFGGVRSIEQTQTFGHAVRTYARLKTVFSFCHTKTPRTVPSVRRSLILDIFGRRNVAQIIQPVIIWVSINMVDVILRPFAVRVKPNQPVRSVALPVNTDHAVAEIIYRPCNAADHYASVSLDAPTQDTRRKIAGKQFLKTFISKHIGTPLVLSCGRLELASRMKAP